MKRPMITDDIIARVATDLDNLPKKCRGKTVGDAIEALKPKLMQARENGYTLEELKTTLEKNGIKASIATLKVYLSKKQQRRGGQRDQRKDRGRQDRSGQPLASNAGVKLEI